MPQVPFYDDDGRPLPQGSDEEFMRHYGLGSDDSGTLLTSAARMPGDYSARTAAATNPTGMPPADLVLQKERPSEAASDSVVSGAGLAGEGITPRGPRNIEPYKTAFVNSIYASALAMERKTGIPAAITTAQAILETGYGERTPKDINTGVHSHNLFGIKAVPKNDFVDDYTHEVLNGSRVRVLAKFAAYKSDQESMDAHAAFLIKNKRYKTLFANPDPISWAKGLQQAGYSTSSQYANSLIDVMNTWHLTPSDR